MASERRHHFDERHYLSQLGLRQRWSIRWRRIDPLDHFLRCGWRAGLDPSAEFSTRGYLSDNPDVRAADTEPLTHWLSHGRDEGRPAVSPEEFSDPAWRPSHTVRHAVHGDELIDFLSRHSIDADPADLRRPLSGDSVIPPTWFDSAWYLDTNPDVRVSGVDPFVHFVNSGFRESRMPNARAVGRAGTIDARLERVLSARDVRSESRRLLSSSTRGAPESPQRLFDHLRSAIEEGGEGRLVVVIGHDDYTANVGGVQLCEGLEKDEFIGRGITHVFFHPGVMLPTLLPSTEVPRVGVVLDGRPLEGEFDIAAVARAWSDSGLGGVEVAAVIVHSILGHSPECIGSLVDVVRPTRTVWWVHDNLSQCSNWMLLRNGVEPCGAPPLTSLSCRLCAWGPARNEHVSRLRQLWSRNAWEFCAPSESAVESAMSGSAPLPVEPTVIPHVELRRAAVDRPALEPGERNLRIGFIGEPRPEKGWEALVAVRNAAPGGVEFIHLGSRPGTVPGVEFAPLRQTADSFGTTEAAIRSHRLDAALIWPESAETFSFVTAEAIAAGCEIITHPSSGNVVAMAERHQRAVVFESLDELLSADLSGIVRSRRGRSTPAWELAGAVGLTPALLDGRGSAGAT